MYYTTTLLSTLKTLPDLLYYEMGIKNVAYNVGPLFSLLSRLNELATTDGDGGGLRYQ